MEQKRTKKEEKGHGLANQVPVVGIGASAGGLEALQQFFYHMSANSGLGFVVIQHLSPDYKSLMADILGKYIALADWKIASILMNEYYCTEVVNLETKAIRTVKDNLKEIAAGEKDACEKLMYALILSGLAMQMTGNSRPASGAEHHMVHLWDMEVVNGHLNALHGEKVSAATMLVLLEYKKLADAIRRGTCRVHAFADGDRELLQETFGRKGILGALEKENTPELLDDVSIETLSGALPEILKIIDFLPAVTDMQEMMSIVGCISRVRDIGLPGKAIEESLRLAPYTRRRLSLLRLRKMLTY